MIIRRPGVIRLMQYKSMKRITPGHLIKAKI